MPTGLSLHIGVNVCDPDHYEGWSGPLAFCEADAEAIDALARRQGFDATLLKTAQATRDTVRDAIGQAADALTAGDLFLVSYAGHGGQIADVNGDEADRIDETWCLYDGQLLDDELQYLWSCFREGVRVLVLSDSCHSGSVTKSALASRDALFRMDKPDRQRRHRFMPRDAAMATQRRHRGFYAEIQSTLPHPRRDIHASVRLLSGCQDEQLSCELDGNGVFTRTLLTVWDDGRFAGDYAEFHRQIISRMAPTQQPNHLVTGKRNAQFDREVPFTI
ncbi:MAG: caspase family protein [Halieaceae bacterium]|jgi:hypothetical protein|nr:caspase family protein [Halieaceae bacterium]